MQPNRKSMKKLIYILFVLFVTLNYVGCHNITNKKLIQEITINYLNTDSLYLKYGYYKEVHRFYNYTYKDSIVKSSMLDSCHGVHTYINEFDDTVHQIFIDYTNYPKREE